MKPFCKICKVEMAIDEWNGWRWTCFICDSVGRLAIDKEIEKYENDKSNLTNK